jgi:hypothetical protein
LRTPPVKAVTQVSFTIWSKTVKRYPRLFLLLHRKLLLVAFLSLFPTPSWPVHSKKSEYARIFPW